MRKIKIEGKKSPEAKIQQAIRDKLTLLGWFVKRTHGNAFTDGWPDLFACHSSHGQRWIEVKLPDMKGSSFTPAQIRDFPKFIANGSGVWILTGDSEAEIEKLFKPPNYWYYLMEKL